MVEKKEYATIHITKATHKEAKEFVGEKVKIGAFADEAIKEKIKKESKEKQKK
jgi:hypothetical protein